jgi:hypothetical protein
MFTSISKNIVNAYLTFYILADMIISFLFSIVNFWLSNYVSIAVSIDALNDILNELISASLTCGALMLAAMAFLASIRAAIQNENSRSGHDWGFTGPLYHEVMKSYIYICFVSILLFALFISLRAFEFKLKLSLSIFATVFLIFVFFRGLLLLYLMLQLPKSKV